VPVLSYIAVAVAGYFLGSIPTGYLVAKSRGVDIRTVGSKNMGATNVFRILGKAPGIFVLLMDGLKGYAACAWVPGALLELLRLANPDPPTSHLIAGIAAVLGHNYTFWLNFKGGKGIATTGGVFLALAPAAVLVALAAWTIVFVFTRYVSAASLVAAVALPTAVCLTQRNWPLRIIAILLGIMAIYKHRANIERLRNGTENRISFKKDKPVT